MELKLVSSLEKVFPDVEPKEYKYEANPTILKGESFSFQVAYTDDILNYDPLVKVKIVSDIDKYIKLKRVGLSPSDYSAPPDADENYLVKSAAMIPDILYDFKEIRVMRKYWQSLWIEIDAKSDIEASTHKIELQFIDKTDKLINKIEFNVEILDIELPKQELILTQWFHADCIGSYYNFEMLSDSHFEMIEKFLDTAHKHGMNMILTPLFTLPLDTEVGGERPTLQLVDVIKTNNTYSFKFDKLKRWIDLCKNIGFEYFEMAPLFTQWGAKATPKIMATVDGQYKRIFGWDVSSSDESYKIFLDSFLPALVEFLKSNNLESKCYFHVSDEPGTETEEGYKNAKELISKHLKGFKIIDALSDISFYEKGLVQNPVPAINHIEPFIKAKVPNLWAYYCCSQYKDVSNRFMAMPSARNRIIATQLFKYDIKGFLHWGFNFYYSQFSKELINPFRVTDAGCGFPSGDSFLVYPGDDGPIESIRLKVFSDALYDLRAMQLLSKLTSKEFVLNLIESNQTITFTDYPHDSEYILSLRQSINNKIKEHIKSKF